MAFTIITRSLIIYLIVLFIIRIMGKRQIGTMQPYELVITLIIADLACIPMAETALPLVHGIIPLLVICCVHFLLGFLERKSIFLRKVINGKSVILITPDGVDYENLKECNMNFNDLQDSLREAGYFNFNEVLYAIFQTNGKLAVLPRSSEAPVKAKDMEIEAEKASLPVIILTKGKLIKENIDFTKITEDFLKKQLKKAGYQSYKDIILATISSDGTMYVQGTEGKFQVFKSEFSGSW